jgi:hypothetical protein
LCANSWRIPERTFSKTNEWLLEKFVSRCCSLLSCVRCFPHPQRNCITSKEAVFQDIGGDDVAEFLEPNSLRLTNEELADLDKQTYKEEQDDDNDDDNVI